MRKDRMKRTERARERERRRTARALRWQKLKDRLLTNRLFFFAITGAIAVIAVLALDRLYLQPDNGRDILVEAHGMLFDIILFGVILTVYETVSERRRNIQRYQQELDYIRFWDEKEAMHRNVGYIKRLNKLGVTAIDLYNSYLKDAPLWGRELKGALLSRANLNGAFLWGADLKTANLSYADLRAADLTSAKLQGANLCNADLRGAQFLERSEQTPYERVARFQAETRYEEAIRLKGQKHYREYLFAPPRDLMLHGWHGTASLEGAELRGAKAYKSQKEDFQNLGVTEQQLRQMVWVPDDGSADIQG